MISRAHARLGLWTGAVLWLMSSPLAVQKDPLVRLKQAALAATYRNDSSALRQTAERFEGMARADAVTWLPHYYAGWTRWMLGALFIGTGDPKSATSQLERATSHLRNALTARPDEPETQVVLAFVLNAISTLQPARRASLHPEIQRLRAGALASAPKNPRVVLLDAGLTFFTPPAFGGSQDRGMDRGAQALALFRTQEVTDPSVPDWDLALAYAWVANLYLSASAPRYIEAREAAKEALRLQPTFWYVQTQIVPRLLKP